MMFFMRIFLLISACGFSQAVFSSAFDSFFGSSPVKPGADLRVIRFTGNEGVDDRASVTPSPPMDLKASDYKLGPGDRLKITVFNEPDLSIDVRLSDAGSFLYPFFGEILVKGMTISELQAKLTDSLADGYIKEPKVYASIIEYRPFFVNGEVSKPGAYAYQPGLTVRKAIALAGGVTSRASLSKIYVIHESDLNGIPKLTSLNNTLLPGDIITVDQSFF